MNAQIYDLKNNPIDYLKTSCIDLDVVHTSFHFPILSIFSFFLSFFHHTHNFNLNELQQYLGGFFLIETLTFHFILFRENSSFWVEITFQWWSSREGTGIYFVMLLQHFFFVCMVIPDKWNIYSRIIVIIIKKKRRKGWIFSYLISYLEGICRCKNLQSLCKFLRSDMAKVGMERTAIHSFCQWISDRKDTFIK